MLNPVFELGEELPVEPGYWLIISWISKELLEKELPAEDEDAVWEDPEIIFKIPEKALPVEGKVIFPTVTGDSVNWYE